MSSWDEAGALSFGPLDAWNFIVFAGWLSIDYMWWVGMGLIAGNFWSIAPLSLLCNHNPAPFIGVCWLFVLYVTGWA